MRYNPIMVAQAASMAADKLAESGQVGRVEATRKAALPETALTKENFNASVGAWIFDFVPAVGKNYKVVIDGVEHQAYTFPIDVILPGAPTDGIAIMDLSPDTTDENAEPTFMLEWLADPAAVYFNFMTAEQSLFLFADATEAEKDHTLSIIEETKTIHPIDPKFLPGVCLPVVELSTGITNGATLTDVENAKLSAAYETGMPVLVKTTDEGQVIAGVWNNVYNDGQKALISTITGLNAMFAWVDDVWTVVIT